MRSFILLGVVLIGVLVAHTNALAAEADDWVEPEFTTICGGCMDATREIEKKLDENSTYAELYQFIKSDICTLLPSSEQEECDKLAAEVCGYLAATSTWIIDGFSPFHLCSMLSLCDVYCCALPYRPEQIHLAVTGNPTEMVVSWVTGEPTPNPQVQYGIRSYTMTANATMSTYKHGGWHGYIYRATMINLTPGTIYQYQVGDPAVDMSFHNFTFRAAPAVPKSGEGQVRMLVLGDMGVTDVSSVNIFTMTKYVQMGRIDAFLHAGDISYANGYQAAWDNYFKKMEMIMGYIPYMAAVGNHEVPFDFSAYRHRFAMPRKQSTGDAKSLYFSFDYGNIHAIAISFEKDLGFAPDTEKNGTQYNWFEQDLIKANANRAAVPWIIVYMHRPLYCSNSDYPCVVETLLYRSRMESLFLKYHVDLVVQAHIHSYERTWPVDRTIPHKSYVNPPHPTYVVAGVGGNREGIDVYPGHQPSWSVARISERGHCILETNGTSSLTWTFYDNTGTRVFDTFTITRS